MAVVEHRAEREAGQPEQAPQHRLDRAGLADPVEQGQYHPGQAKPGAQPLDGTQPLPPQRRQRDRDDERAAAGDQRRRAGRHARAQAQVDAAELHGEQQHAGQGQPRDRARITGPTGAAQRTEPAEQGRGHDDPPEGDRQRRGRLGGDRAHDVAARPDADEEQGRGVDATHPSSRR